jgi:hypothetical protein
VQGGAVCGRSAGGQLIGCRAVDVLSAGRRGRRNAYGQGDRV